MSVNYGTISTNGNMFTLTTDSGGRPEKPPSGLIATRAVETKSGWLGQIYVDKKIVFESTDPWPSSDEAIGEANQRVTAVVAKLFAPED